MQCVEALQGKTQWQYTWVCLKLHITRTGVSIIKENRVALRTGPSLHCSHSEWDMFAIHYNKYVYYPFLYFTNIYLGICLFNRLIFQKIIILRSILVYCSIFLYPNFKTLSLIYLVTRLLIYWNDVYCGHLPLVLVLVRMHIISMYGYE